MNANAAASVHQTIGSRAISRRAALIIVPKLFVDGSTPTPTYDSTASASTSPLKSITSVISTMCITFGRMWRVITRAVAHAERVRRLDVLEFAQLERLAAQEARESGPGRGAENQAEQQQTGIRALRRGREELRILVDVHLHDQHRRGDQEDAGDRVERGVEILDHVVDPALEVSRHDAEQHGERQRDERGESADHERGADALEREIEDVLANLVGTEDVVLGRQQRGRHRDEQKREHGQENREPGHLGPPAANRPPTSRTALRAGGARARRWRATPRGTSPRTRARPPEAP